MGRSLAVAVGAAVAAALIFVLAYGARQRGRMTHCRNNLRMLGQLAHQKLAAGETSESAGRDFWQELRVEHCSRIRPRESRVEWFVKFGGLNPFGCPVRGAHPDDLAEYQQRDGAGFEKLMSDPATIDYQGPEGRVDPEGGGRRQLGADAPGNHPDGTGHVLHVDLSVQEVEKALDVKAWTSPTVP